MTESHVYLLYGERNALIYVGLADNVDARLAQHKEKRWWEEVRSVKTETFGTRALAAKRELDLIRTLQPKYNKAGRGVPMSPPEVRAVSEDEEIIERYGRYVTYPQASEITTASVRTLKRETAAGNLPCYRIGRSRVLRVRTADVLGLIKRVA